MHLSAMGLDGVVLSWVNYEAELAYWISDVLPVMEHDTLYAYATEWLEIIRRLWVAEDEFDYQGRFFNIVKASTNPSPSKNPSRRS